MLNRDIEEEIAKDYVWHLQTYAVTSVSTGTAEYYDDYDYHGDSVSPKIRGSPFCLVYR
jgi:hypothetical protein